MLGDVRYSVMQLPARPDDQVAQTINVMRARVNEDKKNPLFQFWAQQMFDAKGPYSSDLGLVGAAYQHVQGALHFQRDEKTGAGVGGYPEEEVIEVIIRPVDMARYVSEGRAIGDCDCYSMYLACLLETAGIPCDFVTVAADAQAPNQFSHVYVLAHPLDDSGSRVDVPLDASHGEYPGWQVPNRYGKISYWPMNGGINLMTLALATAAGFFAWQWATEKGWIA